MDLVWTYSSKLRRDSVKYEITDECRFKLYKDSILAGGKYHSTYLYTDVEGASKFRTYIDNIIILPENFDFYFLDDIKFYVLESHSAPFTLIDGDLLLNEPLSIERFKLGVEKHLPVYKSYYRKYNEILEKEGIRDIVPYWDSRQDSFNIGLVYIPENFPIQEFLDVYNKVKEFYKTTIEPKYRFLEENVCIEMSVCTYLLSLFANYKKFSYFYFNENTQFKHYSGTRLKFEYCNASTPKAII